MAGRASIVGAAETNVGNVRDHNEDSHFIDPELGIFIVCDGMGGHAAGEVASAIAVQTIRDSWSSEDTQLAADRWLESGTPGAHNELLATITQGVVHAHEAIIAETEADSGKSGMGTTLIAAMVVGGDAVFAHCGDSRAYLVRDGIAMQLTEDQTLLARLQAAGVEVDVQGDGARFRSMLTNALGIGAECKVATFIVPLADGDRFLLCSDGVTEYVEENEVGEVLSKMPSPARAAQRLVELALERGGADNATALVVRVLEAGETARPADQLRREELAIAACPLWHRVNPQQRLRALRIALPRSYPANEKVPALTLGDRVAWIVVDGELEQDGSERGPGALLYPEALLADAVLPDKHGLAVTQTDVRLLALRADDFRELCDDDPELAEVLLAALASEIVLRRPLRRPARATVDPAVIEREETKPESELGRRRTNTDRGTAAPDRPRRPTAPRLQSRANTSGGLIAPMTEVAGDLDRAMDDMTAEHEEVEEAKQLEPAEDDDAEIMVEEDREPTAPAGPSKRRPVEPALSEPEISIEALEAADIAEGVDVDDDVNTAAEAARLAAEAARAASEAKAIEKRAREERIAARLREMDADEAWDEPEEEHHEADPLPLPPKGGEVREVDEEEEPALEMDADEPDEAVVELHESGERDELAARERAETTARGIIAPQLGRPTIVSHDVDDDSDEPAIEVHAGAPDELDKLERAETTARGIIAPQPGRATLAPPAKDADDSDGGALDRAQTTARELDDDSDEPAIEVQAGEPDDDDSDEPAIEMHGGEPDDALERATTIARELDALPPAATTTLSATESTARAYERPNTAALEWEDDVPSEVRAAEAIRELEVEESAEEAVRAISELEEEEDDEIARRRAVMIRSARPASEIEIEERHELEIGELDEGDEPAEMIVSHDDPDDGRVIEILKDTSSQTITMTMPEDDAPAPLVAVESGPVRPRAKRQTDIPD